MWYLDLEKHFSITPLQKLFKNAPDIGERLKLLPFAGFEVEGAATSSKNQISNFANLYSGNFLYNFVIVNNEAASNENDTYRRGIKLKRYFANNIGDRNVFFLDRIHLEHSISKLTCFENNIIIPESDDPARKKFGGETASVPLYEVLLPLLKETRMALFQNYSPWIYRIINRMAQDAAGSSEFGSFHLGLSYYKDPRHKEVFKAKTLPESLYVPKLDVCLGFNAPNGFKAWLTVLAESLGYNEAHFPILYALKHKLIPDLFIQLVGVEIETSVNKHLNGGIYNLAKNTYAGVVVTKENASSHVDFYKRELGVKNVTAYCIKGQDK